MIFLTLKVQNPMNENQLVVIPVEQLEQIIDKKFQEFFRLVKEESTEEEFLTISQACNLLGISKTSLKKRRDEGTIPFFNIGRKVRFRKTDLLNLKKNRMDLLSGNIYEKISPILDEWADYVTELLQEGVKGENLVRSGALLNSAQFEITQGGSGEIAKMLLGFNYYGRILSLKDVAEHSRYPNLDTLEEYVRNYYFAKYGKKSRYQKVLKNRGYDAAVRDLTWALASRIRYPVKKRKRRLFFATTIYNKYGSSAKLTLRQEIAKSLTEEDILNLTKLAKQTIDIEL